MPTAVPMMAASASGLSMTRCEPNLRCRSSVTRKTPPSTPTSSPMTSTSPSRSISWKSAWLSALTMFSLAMASAPGQPLAPHRRGARLGRGRLVGRRRRLVLARRQLVALGDELRRELGVHVIEHRQRVGSRRGLEATNGLRDLVVDPLLEAILEEIALLEISLEAGQRVLLLPHRDLGVAPVLGRIVGRGVHAQAIGHALDQSRTVAGARPVDRLTRGRVDSEHIVTVHLEAGQPVRQGLLGDRARVRLLLERHRDRPLVVLAHEDDRHVPDAGEVQRLVEVALGGCAVAEVRHHDHVVAPILRGVGEPDRVGQLRRHRDRDRQVVLVGPGLAALEVAREEEQELLDRPAPPDHRPRLAERRHHPVRRPQGEDAPQLGSFLALGRRAWAQARCRGSRRCRGSTGTRPGTVVRGRFWALGARFHSNARTPERYFFAAARLAGAGVGAASSARLALASGRFSPEATRLARLSLRASIRSITWARGASGAAGVTSLPSTFWLTRSRTRWRYSSSYCSGWNSSLDRPSMSWPARSSSPGLIFADCPRSISLKSRTSSAKYMVWSMRPPCAGRMSTRLSLPRMTNFASATRPCFSIASARSRYALSPPLSGPRKYVFSK